MVNVFYSLIKRKQILMNVHEELKKKKSFCDISLLQLNDKFHEDDGPSVIYAISMAWFKDWENFVRGKSDSKSFHLLPEYVIEIVFYTGM